MSSKNKKRNNVLNISGDQLINVHEDRLLVIPPSSPENDIPNANLVEAKMKYYGMISENLKAIGAEDDMNISKDDFSWVRKNNSFFVTAKPNTETIPAGLYDIKVSMQAGVYLEKRSVILDELFYIPDDTIKKIVVDMNKFWNARARYEEYGITYKRGILMYGPPGTGKTSLINLLIAQIISEYNGIVLNVEDIDNFISMSHTLRALEPDKPILAIIEDLDSFMMYNSTKKFLNVLDGNLQVDNVVYLATTNYLDRLEDRIKNRPSRFDRRYEIGYPKDDARKFYFENKLKEEDLLKYPIDQWVKDTDQFTFSHLRELIASVVVMDNDYHDTIAQLRSMYTVSE